MNQKLTTFQYNMSYNSDTRFSICLRCYNTLLMRILNLHRVKAKLKRKPLFLSWKTKQKIFKKTILLNSVKKSCMKSSRILAIITSYKDKIIRRILSLINKILCKYLSSGNKRTIKSMSFSIKDNSLLFLRYLF